MNNLLILNYSPQNVNNKTCEDVIHDKNEPSRFLGEGVSYKAKLIGILEVSDPRGDRMCQEALADLKMAIRAAGEHKQRITINIAIDGLRLRDDKTGDCLYHHPVHKISFIAQDMSDSRAFGYIFGSPDTGHRFFGIKTDKAASQVVISMRDLFQVVFELKKKEIEMAKQHIEQHQIKYGMGIYSDLPTSKSATESSTSSTASKLRTITEDSNTSESAAGKAAAAPSEAIADLLDLEFELNSIQQGISQMESITPSDPFGDSFTSTSAAKLPPPPGKSTSSVSSVTATPPPAISKDRQWLDQEADSVDTPPPSTLFTPAKTDNERHWFDRETEALFDEGELPMTPPSQSSVTPSTLVTQLSKSAAKEEPPAEPPPSTLPKDSFDVFTDLDPLGTGRSKPYIDKKDFFQDLKNPPKKVLKDLVTEMPSDNNVPLFQANFDDVSQSASNNVEVLQNENTLFASNTSDPFADDPFSNSDPFSEADFPQTSEFSVLSATNDPFDTYFADFTNFSQQSDECTCELVLAPIPPELKLNSPLRGPLRVSLPPEKLNEIVSIPLTCRSTSPPSPRNRSKYSRLHKQTTLSGLIKIPSPKHKPRSRISKQMTVDSCFDRSSPVMEGMTLKNRNIATPSPPPTIIFLGELAPEPPPRPAPVTSLIKPPPLPPKRQPQSAVLRPPARPPHAEDQPHYDYIENCESSGEIAADIKSPPIPVPARKPRLGGDHDNNPPYRPAKQTPSTEPEYYLTPFPLLPPPQKKNASSPKSSSVSPSEVNISKPVSSSATSSLDITLSQLSKSGFSELAAALNMSPTSLSKMTLHELTNTLLKLTEVQKSDVTPSESIETGTKLTGSMFKTEQYTSLAESIDEDTPPFKAEFENHFTLSETQMQTDEKHEKSLYDKYAVFRELLEQEKNEAKTQLGKDSQEELPKATEAVVQSVETEEVCICTCEPVDKYAALRDICIDNSATTDKDEILSDKEDSITDMKGDDEFDVLTLSRQQSESTESPTATVKESQSVIETTIIEEDISTIDDYEVPEEAIGEVNTALPTVEESNESLDASESPVHASKEPSKEPSTGSIPSLKDDIVESVEDATVKDTNTCTLVEGWAKFDNGSSEPVKVGSEGNSEGNISPWSVDSRDMNKEAFSPSWKDQPEVKHHKGKRHRASHKEWQDDESEEGWDGRRSDHSFWDEPSWRENGWSDGDSTYDEPHFDALHRMPYHTQRQGRRRRVSPWRKSSRDPSPWEDDDRDLSEDQWECKKWEESWQGRSKRRGTSWDEERRRDDSRKRRTSPWSTEGDRRSSRESLTWEDDDRYQNQRRYRDRRRRRWEDHGYTRNRDWRDQGRRNYQYCRDQSHESPWEDEYSEQGEEESPRSQNRKQIWPRSRHSEEESYDRRYAHPPSREDQILSDSDRHWIRKSQTLQARKIIRYKKRQSQNSPFEDDFSSHNFSFTSEKSPGAGSDISDHGTRLHSTSQSPSDIVLKRKDGFSDIGKCSPQDSGSKSVGLKSNQRQSPFEDDFAPAEVRRCSGRSASSDISDKRDEEHRASGDDVVFTGDVNGSEIICRPQGVKLENIIELSINKKKTKNIHPSDTPISRPKQETDVIDEPLNRRLSERRQQVSELKGRISNLKRTDSASSLRKSESVNIFARNSDPFDDDFFSSDSGTLPRCPKDDKQKSNIDPFKWTEAFSSFNFDQHAK